MKPEDVAELLNKQTKRIKELEEENKFLEKRNEKLIIDRRDICLERNDIFEENQQLKEKLKDIKNNYSKHSPKQLAISELEALAKFSEENAYYYEEEQFAKQINKYISEKIKSLRGEE